MYLNSRRSVLRKVYFTALGSSLAGTHKEIPEDVVKAVTDTKREAADLATEINAVKMKAAKGWE